MLSEENDSLKYPLAISPDDCR